MGRIGLVVVLNQLPTAHSADGTVPSHHLVSITTWLPHSFSSVGGVIADAAIANVDIFTVVVATALDVRVATAEIDLIVTTWCFCRCC